MTRRLRLAIDTRLARVERERNMTEPTTGADGLRAAIGLIAADWFDTGYEAGKLEHSVLADRLFAAILRTVDINEGTEPAPEVLDRLVTDGHARNGFCERCWGDAYLREVSRPSKSQGEHYLDILAEAALAPSEPTDG